MLVEMIVKVKYSQHRIMQEKLILAEDLQTAVLIDHQQL